MKPRCDKPPRGSGPLPTRNPVLDRLSRVQKEQERGARIREMARRLRSDPPRPKETVDLTTSPVSPNPCSIPISPVPFCPSPTPSDEPVPPRASPTASPPISPILEESVPLWEDLEDLSFPEDWIHDLGTGAWEDLLTLEPYLPGNSPPPSPPRPEPGTYVETTTLKTVVRREVVLPVADDDWVQCTQQVSQRTNVEYNYEPRIPKTTSSITPLGMLTVMSDRQAVINFAVQQPRGQPWPMEWVLKCQPFRPPTADPRKWSRVYLTDDQGRRQKLYLPPAPK